MIKFGKTIIPIIFEDSHLLIINKPSGVASQRGVRDDQSLVEAVKNYFSHSRLPSIGNVAKHIITKNSTSPENEPYVGLLHRLDKCTSGLMLLAKNRETARKLSLAFSQQQIHKEYIAVVCVAIQGDNVRKYDNLLLSSSSGSKAQQAVLLLEPIYRFQYKQPANKGNNHNDIHQPLTVVRVQLITGRKHQIRAQLSHLQHLIFADRDYGAISHLSHHYNFVKNSIALCCTKLAFQHPVQQHEQCVHHIPLPPHWNTWFGEYHVNKINRSFLERTSSVEPCLP
jgi:23S rRNA pseudouridine1911/1915/1917 synthase